MRKHLSVLGYIFLNAGLLGYLLKDYLLSTFFLLVALALFIFLYTKSTGGGEKKDVNV